MIPRRFHPLANALAVLALIAPLLCAAYIVRQTRHEAAVAVATVTREAAAEREVSEAVLAAYSEQIAHLTSQRDKARAEAKAVSEDNAALRKRLTKPKPRVEVKRAAKSRPAVKRYSGSIPTLIRSIAKAHGYGSADTSALLELARRESTLGANRKAYARGRECVGLWQLDSDKGSYAQRCDDEWATHRAIKYIKGRYGSPRKALAFHDARGWY